MEELTILAVSDNSYLPFVRTLFNSIKANVKIPYTFHLHAINVPDPQIELFNTMYSSITFSRETITLDDAPFKSNAFRKSKKASYCANIRAKVLYDLMLQGRKYILYLDADSIVRRDLKDLLTLIKYTDLIIFRRDNETDVRTKVLTSVIGINNNNKSLNFIENWMNCMLQQEALYTWFSDQKYFYKTMTKFLHVKIQPLPDLYVDSGFKGRSYIWNGKAARKFSNVNYIKEMEKYK
jgi:lipopolysaccharide biosynthesis glycosyltransferase